MRLETIIYFSWSKATTDQSGSLFGKLQPKLNFNIAEDTETYIPIPYTVKNFHLGIQLPKDFVSKNDKQTEWEIPMVIEEPINPNSMPMYNKLMLYPKKQTKGMEFTHEELRGYNWFNSQGVSNELTERLDSVWLNKYENGIRLPPGFSDHNIEQDEMKHSAVDLDLDVNPDNARVLKLLLLAYPNSGGGEEVSFEERMKVQISI